MHHHRRKPRCDGPGECRSRAGRVCKALAQDRGSVTLIVASAMFGLIGSAAFAVELGQVYLQQTENQRVADMSAVAAGLAYSQTLYGSGGTTAKAAAAGTAAGNSLAVSNGMRSGSTVSTSFAASPSGDGNTAALVQVGSSMPLGTLSAMMAGAHNLLGIANASYAEIKPTGSTACIIALSGSVALSGGANLSASNCTVNSGSAISAASGTTLSALAVYAVGAITGGTAITTTPTAGRLYPGSPAPSDPLASYTSAAFSTLTGVATPAALPAMPAFPTVPAAPSGGATDPSPSRTSASYTLPSTGPYKAVTLTNWSGSNWNVTIPAGTQISGALTVTGGTDTILLGTGVYEFGGLSVPSGATQTTVQTSGTVTLDLYSSGLNAQSPFALTVASGTVTLNIVAGGLTTGGASTFGPGTYNIYGGITANGTTSFAASPFNIYSGGINLGGSTSSTFGAGNFNVYGGIWDNSSNTTTFGSGNYVIYTGTASSCTPASAGICMTGGGTLTLGSAGTSSFNVTGGIGIGGGGVASLDGGPAFVIRNGGVTTGGGSTLTFGADAAHNINGALALGGSANLGAGIYYVFGALTFGANGTGSGSVSGTNVSLITSGAFTVDAGFNAVSLVAPTTGSLANITIAGPSPGGATITSGANSTELQGALYFPSGPLTLGGSGNLNGGGTCLEIVAASLSETDGTSSGTTCPGLPSYANVAGGVVTLVQ